MLTTQANKIRQAVETLKIISMQTRRVPEETQTGKSIESPKAVQSFPGKWSIDEQVRGFRTKRHQAELRLFSLPGLESGKLLQQCETLIAYVPPGLEQT